MEKKYKQATDQELEALLENALDMVDAIQREKRSRAASRKSALWENLIGAVKAYCEVDTIEVFDLLGQSSLGFLVDSDFDPTPGLITLH